MLFRASNYMLSNVLLVSGVVVLSCGAAQAGYTAVDLYTLGNAPGATPYQGPNAFSFQVSDQKNAAGGQVVANGSGGQNDPTGRGLLWNGSSTPIDLGPANLSGYSSSTVLTTNGQQQVGWAVLNQAPYHSHAMVWNGSGDSAVDLHPSNFLGLVQSQADGTDGHSQVGRGSDTTGVIHALLWTGSADSVVALSVANIAATNADAMGIDGTDIAGLADSQAVMWTGPSHTAVSLNPSQKLGKFQGSTALDVRGGQEIGFGTVGPDGKMHALLWTGSADSVVDLTPHQLGVTDAAAQGTNGLEQAGVGWIGGYGNIEHAFVWSGTADSAVDLHAVLPSDFVASDAYSVDANGDVFGVAYDSTSHWHAIEWIPATVPEPSSIAILSLLSAPALRRRRK